MSDAPQGPGWWQASDGKWYPPGPAAAPGPSRQQSGCRTAAIVVGVVVLVLVLLSVLSIVAITFLGRSTSDKLDRLEGDIESSAAAVIR